MTERSHRLICLFHFPCRLCLPASSGRADYVYRRTFEQGMVLFPTAAATLPVALPPRHCGPPVKLRGGTQHVYPTAAWHSKLLPKTLPPLWTVLVALVLPLSGVD